MMRMSGIYAGADTTYRLTVVEASACGADPTPVDTTGWAVEAKLSTSGPTGRILLTISSEDGDVLPVDEAKGIWDLHFRQADTADLPKGLHDLRVDGIEPGGERRVLYDGKEEVK